MTVYRLRHWHRDMIRKLLVLIILALPAAAVQACDTPCPQCHSSGWIDCPRCRRDGDLWCSRCAQLKGYCPVCRNTGHVRCPNCKHNKHGGRISPNPWASAARLGAALIIIEDRSLRLATDVSHEDAHEFFNILAGARRHLRRQFHVPKKTQLWNGRCTVYVFKDHKTYIRFTLDVDNTAEMTHTGAYSRTARNCPLIAISRQGRDRDEIRRIALHELAHVFLDLYQNDTKMPIWLSEGVAQWFEFRHKPKGSRRADCMKRVKTAFASGAGPRIVDILDRPIAPDDAVDYAIAWSLTSFLIERDKARNSDDFRDFVILLKSGTPQPAAMTNAFGMPINRIERTWRLYIRRTY